MLILCCNISYAQTKADPHNYTATASAPEETVSVPEQNQHKAEEENISTDLSAKELAVQKRMANAAEEANRLTKGPNWIGIIGLGLLGLTTFFAFGAWRAGRDAVATTREIGQKQVKAYLSFESAYWQVQGMIIILKVTLKNHGQSPCITGKVDAVVGMHRFKIDMGEGKILENSRVELRMTPNRFGMAEAGRTVDAVMSAGTCEIEDGQWHHLAADPDTNVDFRITVEYEDVFGVTEKIHFTCHEVDEKNSEEGIEERFKKLPVERMSKLFTDAIVSRK